MASCLPAGARDTSWKSSSKEVERDARLLTHWDTNKNGLWDKEERTADQEAVADLAVRFSTERDQRNWYLLHEGGVFGPLRLKSFLDEERTPDLLG